MSERYSTRFSLVENLYVEDAPVIISAGNLLKDSQTGKVLVQLKIKNISAKIIKAARVSIHAFDMVGKPLEDAEKEYLDIAVCRGAEFGQKVAILLPDISTNGFTVEVRQVAFADGSIWESAKNAVWEPLPKEETASLFLQDSELFKQFQLKYGENCDTIPKEYKDLWLCVCGTWNNDTICYSCKMEKAALFPFNLDELIYEKNTRLEQERLALEAEEEAKREAALKRAKVIELRRSKRQAFTKKALIASLTTVLVAFIIYAIGWHVIPYTRYKKACDALNSQDYDMAYSAFEALNGFSDSKEKSYEALYQKGKSLMNSGAFRDATEVFASITIYQDSIYIYKDSYELYKQCRNEASYIDANTLFDDGQYKEAADLFETLDGFKDSEERTKESKYKYALASFDSEDYETAFSLFSELASYKDVEERLPEAKYLYAISLSDKGDLVEASRLFKELGEYQDSNSRYRETFYNYGLSLFADKSYMAAVNVFTELGEYQDSKAKVNEAKYGYITTHENSTDYTTYRYLKDLKASNYKDCDKIYSSLYKWSVTIVMNDNVDDTTTNKTSISKYGDFCCHVTLSGGPPTERIKLKYVITYPDGSSYTGKWDDKFSNGQGGVVWGSYDTPAYGAEGTFRAKIYNDSDGKLLGEGSIKIS